MSERLQVAGGTLARGRGNVKRLLSQVTTTDVLLGALPIAILAASPDRVPLSLAIAAFYVAAALWLARDWRANLVVLVYALAVAAFFGISYLRMEFLDGLNAAQRTYGGSKALYVVAVVLPLSAAVAALVRETRTIRGVVAMQIAIGVAVSISAVIERSGTVLGPSRYAWEGNLIAIGFVLACQFWLIRDTRIVAVIGALAIAGVMFAGARQSLVVLVVGLLASAAFWLAVGLRRSGRRWVQSARDRRVFIPVAAVLALGAAVVLSYAVLGPLVRLPNGQVTNPCQCVTYRVVEVFSDPGGHDVLVKDGLRLFAGHPLVGGGLGSFVGQVKGYQYPHNILLEVGAELGLVGLAILFLPLLAAGLRLIRNAYAGQDTALTSLLALALCYFVVANLSGDAPSARAFWIFAIVALKLAYSEVRPAASKA